MGAGAMTICHNKTAVQVKEDMKKMVQMPMLRARTVACEDTKVFGASLFELQEKGLLQDGVPVVVRRMVEHLHKHALQQEGLFRVNGNVRAVETLRQRLDSGEHVDLASESDLCTVASLLKKFLRDLPEGLVDSSVQQALIQLYQEVGDDVSWSDMRNLLQQLPDVHHRLLRFLCHFLTLVESNHGENRMNAFNLATVFGPSVFHVSGFEAMKDQNICNKIMVKLIQNYSNLFEPDTGGEGPTEQQSAVIVVKEAHVTDANQNPSLSPPTAKTPAPVPRTKTGQKKTPQNPELPNKSSTILPEARPRKRKVRKGKSDDTTQMLPVPRRSGALPHARPLLLPIDEPLTPGLRSASAEVMDTAPVPLSHHDTPDTAPHPIHLDVSLSGSVEALGSSQEDDRPMSPFYMSCHLSPFDCRPDVVNFLDRTIRASVEQHLFGSNPLVDQSSDDSELNPSPLSPRATARQRRRNQREQQEEGLRHKDRNRATSFRATDTNKENIPSGLESVRDAPCSSVDSEGGQGAHTERTSQSRKSKHSPTLVQLTENQDAQAVKECVGDRPGENHMETFQKENDISRKDGGRPSPPQTLRMKIQESPVTCDTGREVFGSDTDCEKNSCDDVPRLDLTALTEDNNWGEPVPAYSPMQRESMDREEARLSPHAGGRLIRQLVEEDSDPMLSPRFYAYGHGQQYLDDTEVPPSPPNSHAFASRRRSSSLGSCPDDDKGELTSTQLTRRIHVLKKKIHKYEERFEEERKYRPSHGDKAGNPEVLRWMNELSKLRKDLKEHKLLKSEEDLPPMTRQRSNTLPKSFGSQLEKKPTQQEKVPKPPVESTLETIQKKLQEKRGEVNRPEDIKDMTREQIGAEKVALQKALLYYESIHSRPVSKSERQIMKPLYDRYRLVKQILCRASTIPVIEEEDGSEDDSDSKTQFVVTVRPDISVLGFLEHMDEEADGFISPVDDLSPSKNMTDMRLSNLHSATMPELVEQLQETREEKKRLRKNLKEFEDQFFRQNGRTAQKEDRSPLAVEYNEYKHVKAKLRLLEVLISKRDSTKLI